MARSKTKLAVALTILAASIGAIAQVATGAFAPIVNPEIDPAALELGPVIDVETTAISLVATGGGER